jgi:hypothetical protein
MTNNLYKSRSGEIKQTLLDGLTTLNAGRLSKHSTSAARWVRNQVHGNNQRKEGDGSTKMLIDDLQPILAKKPLTAISKETDNIS